MAITTISSREFNQNASAAKRAAENGPVFITDRGRTAYVLMSIREYQKIAAPKQSLAELLAMPGDADFDFEAPRLDDLARPADHS